MCYISTGLGYVTVKLFLTLKTFNLLLKYLKYT